MIVGRLKASPKIPVKFRDIYERLAGIVIDTLGVRDEFVTLFATKETVELLNTTALTFFKRQKQLLVNHIVLSLSRLTDEKQSGSHKNPQDNLTLAQLLDLPEDEYNQLRVDLQERWKKIKVAAKPVRLYRHKWLAHASLPHYLSPSTDLDDDNRITLDSINDLLDQINDYLGTFDCFFTDINQSLSYPPSYGEVTDLLTYLRWGVDAEKKRDEERHKAVAVR